MRIRCLKYFLLLSVCFYSGTTKTRAQTIYDSTIYRWKNYFDLSYGPDYNLINGVKYYYLYSDIEGHPFFGEDQFYTGSLMIVNRKYQDVYLKYEIYNQKIILQYIPFSGGTNQILLRNEDIHEFKIDGKLFSKYSFPETGTRFYQVVTPGKIYCLYYWEKELNYSTLSAFNFSNQKKVSYLIKNGKPYRFRNRRNFRKLFPAQYQKEIKQFIRKNKTWLRNKTDNEMRHLLDFCNQLIENR